jgi:hypothetical protein
MPSLNNHPCGGCLHFDRITPKGNHGRCAVQSVYPYKEQAGQAFPAGVKRAEPGALAKPVIVTRAQIVEGCAKYRSK